MNNISTRDQLHWAYTWTFKTSAQNIWNFVMQSLVANITEPSLLSHDVWEPNGTNWLCLLWPQRSFHCLYVQFHRTHQFIQYYPEVQQTEISVTEMRIETRLRTNYVRKEKTQIVRQHKYYTARINIDICGLLVSTRSLLYFSEQTTLQPQNHSLPVGAATTNQ